jgi:hypothetical protein
MGPVDTNHEPAQIERECHLKIDNYPANLATIRPGSYNETQLLVNAPTVTMIYERTSCSENNEVAQTDREIQAIIASFHDEKVIPTGGTR